MAGVLDLPDLVVQPNTEDETRADERLLAHYANIRGGRVWQFAWYQCRCGRHFPVNVDVGTVEQECTWARCPRVYNDGGPRCSITDLYHGLECRPPEAMTDDDVTPTFIKITFVDEDHATVTAL